MSALDSRLLQDGEWIGLPVAIPLQLKLACLWNDLLRILFVAGEVELTPLIWLGTGNVGR